MALAELNDKREGERIIRQIAEELHRRGVTPEEVGAIKRVSLYQSLTKDAEGEAHVHDLFGFHLSPSWEAGPQWPVVQPAAPVRLPALKARKASPVRTTAIFPDPQIGYRRLDSGEMIPMHDQPAIDAAMRVAEAAKVDRIVNLGDTLDLPEWSSKFLVLPEFVLTTQPTLDEGHRFLARQRSVAPEVDLLEGNHDARLGMAIARNAMAALRLRRAASPPDDWPVLSIPFLLRLDKLGVNYVGAYPAGRLKLTAGNDTLAPLIAVHGEKLDMRKVATSERQSVVQGHTHRVAAHACTYEIDGRPVTVWAYSLGCLSRRDGAVPSSKGGTDSFGRPAVRWEDWQHGMGVVTEYEDGVWAMEVVPIESGVAYWRGKSYGPA